MKFFFLTSILLAAASLFGADTIDLTKPIPALAISDGRVFKNVTITKFNVSDVVIRHTAGTVVLRYEFLPDEVRFEAEKKRPGGPRTVSSRVTTASDTYAGQVFVTTRGASSYKFSSVAVYAFPLSVLNKWQETNALVVDLPFPISKTTTDADGKFRIQVPKSTPFFLFAQANRLVGDKWASYEWRAPSAEFEEKDNVQLNEKKWLFAKRPVTIAESP